MIPSGRLLIALCVLSSLLFFATDCYSSGMLELKGAGATFPQPFYEALFSIFNRQSNIKVRYEGVGSGEGLRRFVEKSVDFAGTDKRMKKNTAFANFPAVLHIPTCVGAVVMVYNVPGNPKLRFTPDIIADIYFGKIRRWNDGRIAAINGQAKLPDMPITVVFRSDASGTTFIFSEYLSKTRADWRDSVGSGTSLKWPVGQGVKGNPGVAGLVRQIPGTIGYVELVYAIGNSLTFGSIKNRSGNYIEPTVQSVSAAASIDLSMPGHYSLTDTKVHDGYPISAFTWIVVYQEQGYGGRTKEQAEGLLNLLSFIINDGQKQAPLLYYAPLPKSVRKSASSLLEKVTYDGNPVYKMKDLQKSKKK